MTPLHWAVESGDATCVELLLRHGAEVEIVSKFDKTPLEIASDRHYTDIYEMLLVSTGDFFDEWNQITPQTHIRKFEEQTT